MRMNLDNEQHRRIHMILSDLNTNVHKSVNQFLIDATDAYIRKLEGSELTNEENDVLSPLLKSRERCDVLTPMLLASFSSLYVFKIHSAVISEDWSILISRGAFEALYEKPRSSSSI